MGFCGELGKVLPGAAIGRVADDGFAKKSECILGRTAGLMESSAETQGFGGRAGDARVVNRRALGRRRGRWMGF